MIPSPKEIALNVVDLSKNILHLAAGWTHVLILMGEEKNEETVLFSQGVERLHS